eukprot:6492730-Amphidinium_carterae.7
MACGGNGLRRTVDGYKESKTILATIRQRRSCTTQAITSISRQQCSTVSTTTLTTPQTSRVGTTTGMTTSSRRTWSTDYIHSKKRAYHEHSKHQLLQHKKTSTNATFHTCHSANGVESVDTLYKERAGNNSIRKVVH